MTNKIITTIEQDRERLADFNNPEKTGYRVGQEFLGAMLHHNSLSIEHVLESLKEEVEAKKRGKDFFSKDARYESMGFTDKLISRSVAETHEDTLTEILSLIDEVIKHVKKYHANKN